MNQNDELEEILINNTPHITTDYYLDRLQKAIVAWSDKRNTSHALAVYMNDLQAKNEALEAEIARLREALQNLYDFCKTRNRPVLNNEAEALAFTGNLYQAMKALGGGE